MADGAPRQNPADRRQARVFRSVRIGRKDRRASPAPPALRALNMAPTRARARAEGPLFVEFPGFSPRPEPSGDVKECSHTVYRLHTKKPLPWRVTGARVVRHVERPRVRSKNVYIAEPAPELQPMCCARLAPRAERSAWSWTSTLEKWCDLQRSHLSCIQNGRSTDYGLPEADRGSRRLHLQRLRL